jgi:phosphoserine phosphatase RsbU/P
MNVLVVDDDPLFRRLLANLLAHDYDVVSANNGEQAWEVLCRPDRPAIAAVNWMMPQLDGLELCRRVRLTPATAGTYLLLITGKEEAGDVVEGLRAGADDYIVKPFHADELRARVKVGERVVGLQQTLEARIRELQAALDDVRALQRLLPICSYCKRVRSDQNYWEELESYLAQHCSVEFSHGICPECLDRYVSPELKHSGQEHGQ